MNRKMEIAIGSIIVILIVSFFGIKFLGNTFDKDNTLKKIDEAIVNGDMDYLVEHIEVEGLGRELTEEETRNIYKVIKDVSVFSLNEKKDDPEANIFIMQKGKEKLFFDKYIIVLKAYKLIISPNMEGTQIIINDGEVGEFEEAEEFVFKNLIPGIHKLKLVYQGDYGEIEAEEEIIAFNREGTNEIYSSLEIDEKYIYIESNLEEATLLIDGEDTEINIYNGYKLGPIGGEKIKIAAKVEVDGKEYTSQTEEISDSSESNYNLFIDYKMPMSDKEILEKVEKLIDAYEIGLVKAVNNGSYTYLENYIEDGSPFMETQKKHVANLYEKGITEELLSYKIEDINIIWEEEVFVTVSENHMITYKSGRKNEVNNKWTYTLTNKDGEFLIRKLE